jgi:hypothetical protein
MWHTLAHLPSRRNEHPKHLKREKEKIAKTSRSEHPITPKNALGVPSVFKKLAISCQG